MLAKSTRATAPSLLSERVRRAAARPKPNLEMLNWIIWRRRMEPSAQGDPKECRKRAFRCADLAHTARTPELKKLLIQLSQNWLRLSIELERSAALLDEYAPEPEKTA